MIDYRHLDALASHQVWIPFHFLPGNFGLPVGNEPDGKFIKKLVCKPNSYSSIDMVNACIDDNSKPYALHRLGIAMHVYADTWAHQGFAGVNHKINEVKDLVLENEETDMNKKISDYFGDIFDSVKQKFVNDKFPLGHGAALTCPDKPYLKWHYTNGLGELVSRDNPSDFHAAVALMFKYMTDFRKKRGDTNVATEANENDLNKILANFNDFRDEKGDARHEKWIASIRNEDFSFGSIELSYIPKGEGSWKYKALGQLKDVDQNDDKFEYNSSFLESDWKMFHDALQAHYFDVVHDILPKYGICAA